jgi:hypothetical protein
VDKQVFLPLFISIIVAISLTFLVIMYLLLIIAGVLLVLVAVIVFGVILTVTWFVLRLLLLPYYALRQVKPNEEESRGGYRLENVKQAKSELQKMQQKSESKKLFCSQCRGEVKSDAIFCPNCGAKVE